MEIKSVLSIAGTDPTGGAGSQADVKTITVHGLFAMNVVTAVVAQNTVGVREFTEMPVSLIESQLDCVFEDIVPDAVKIGMVSSADIICGIAGKLRQYGAQHVVVDPVMVATSGGRLLSPEAEQTLRTELIPLAEVVTPNIPEAECLCGYPISSREQMAAAAHDIAEYTGGGILLKGGHLEDSADDLLVYRGEEIWYPCEKIDNPNTHGTGCTLSSAIACNLASGFSVPDSVRRAKDYITGALKAGLDLGKGSGPLHHGYLLREI